MRLFCSPYKRQIQHLLCLSPPSPSKGKKKEKKSFCFQFYVCIFVYYCILCTLCIMKERNIVFMCDVCRFNLTRGGISDALRFFFSFFFVLRHFVDGWRRFIGVSMPLKETGVKVTKKWRILSGGFYRLSLSVFCNVRSSLYYCRNFYYFYQRN